MRRGSRQLTAKYIVVFCCDVMHSERFFHCAECALTDAMVLQQRRLAKTDRVSANVFSFDKEFYLFLSLSKKKKTNKTRTILRSLAIERCKYLYRQKILRYTRKLRKKPFLIYISWFYTVHRCQDKECVDRTHRNRTRAQLDDRLKQEIVSKVRFDHVDLSYRKKRGFMKYKFNMRL